MVTIKLSNKLFYSLIVVLVLLLIGVGVYAYGTSSPSVMGHTFSEIGTPYGCSSGQFLKYAPGDTYGPWVCDTSTIPTTYVRNVEIEERIINPSTTNPIAQGDIISTQFYCATGKKVLGGGCILVFPTHYYYNTKNGPVEGRGWKCEFVAYRSSGTTPLNYDLRGYAICANY